MKLEFKSTKQSLPKDGEYILCIKTDRSLFYEDSPLPEFYQCEWSWSDGEGCQLCHSEEYSLENPPEGYPYLLILNGDGYSIWTNETNPGNPEIEHIWWMSQKEFDTVWKNSKH
jgi:hypothetical protein